MDTTPPPVNSQNRRHLRRWNSISTSICSFHSASDDLELLPIQYDSHIYSSMKDMLPRLAVNSPNAKSTLFGPDICIRNPLVKQAARAYLTPMSDYPPSAAGNFFHRICTGVAALIDFFCRKVVGILNGALRAVWTRRAWSDVCQ